MTTDKTAHKNIRVGQRLWYLVGLIAKRRGETITAVIVAALTRYAKAHATDEETADADAKYPAAAV